MSDKFDHMSITVKSSRRFDSIGTNRPRKSAKTYQSILDSALEYLWTYPFRDLTVAELMLLSGASRPTFYQYFTDLHELMEVLLDGMRDEILDVARPWLQGHGDPVSLLHESLTGLVKVGFERGPILRAVSDAAVSDARLDSVWNKFLQGFDDAVTAKIEEQQSAGIISPFPARPVAMALNRLDAALLTEQFGRMPRGAPEPVLEALTRVWTSTLYNDRIPSRCSAKI